MELFVADHEVLRLEAALPSAFGAARLDILVHLAWALRQRDTASALQYCHEAEQTASTHAPHAPMRRAVEARLSLVRAEIDFLNGAIDKAEPVAQQALLAFRNLDHASGTCDAYILLSMIANELAHTDERVSLREKALQMARRADDVARILVCAGTLTLWRLLREPTVAWQEWLALREQELCENSPVAQAMAFHVEGLNASLSTDFAAGINCWIKAYHASIATGQIRQAIITACNIGDCFNNMNEHQAALEWLQKGLDLARPRGWPSAIALALCQSGETLRRLGRLDVAHEMLHEATKTQHGGANTRVYVSGLAYLADLELDRKDYTSALRRFDDLLARSDMLQHADLQIGARRGRAHALTALGQSMAALQTASEARHLAQQAKDVYREIEVLKVLADIHAKHNLPTPEGMHAANASLHYLYLARSLAESVSGYTIPGDLYDAMGEAYVRANDLQSAYQSALLASRARDKTQSNEATKRAIALQVQLQTERALALRAQQAQLAAAEARRAQALQHTSATLSRLCVIGQDITAQLDMDAVLRTLARHVQALLDLHALVIFLLDNQRRVLTRALLYEAGRSLPAKEIPLDDPSADSARCAREQREILRDWSHADAFPNHISGSLVTKTSLFVPLLLGERVLGVMSVQSLLPNAFGEHERLVFRTLCAFGAIALDNALTYRQLQQAQQRLVAQEKLAALGGLVAGVAHELNTPIGNCLIATSTLQDSAYQLEQKISQGNLQRQDLLQLLQDTEQAGEMLLRGLSNAAGLVASFKQVAVDRASEQQRRFDLLQTCTETVATMMNQIRLAGHHIDLQIAPQIWLDSYPGPLGQVIAHLIHNSIVHGFGERAGGHMVLHAQILDQKQIKLVFSDDGMGIAPHVLPHVFEPFFSTQISPLARDIDDASEMKMGGGCGLGLSISFNIVTSLLNGSISVTSALGKGTVLTIMLPYDPKFLDDAQPT